ncbi:hypothetical protein K0M31_002171, partial [Melipona bicolor]
SMSATFTQRRNNGPYVENGKGLGSFLDDWPPPCSLRRARNAMLYLPRQESRRDRAAGSAGVLAAVNDTGTLRELSLFSFALMAAPLFSLAIQAEELISFSYLLAGFQSTRDPSSPLQACYLGARRAEIAAARERREKGRKPEGWKNHRVIRPNRGS